MDAEGFVKEDRGRTLEEVAEGYLTMLIRRSLVQVVSINSDGRAKRCRVHDLVHAMILKKCEDLSFCKNISEDKQSTLTGMARRQSIAADTEILMESIENSQVRSLLVYKPKSLSETFVRRIPTKYRQLKVLDIDHDRLLQVPEDLQCLSHLKYCRFGNSMYESYFPPPKSIGMLRNLETLDLGYTKFMSAMPKEICMLRKLRHFIGGQMNLILLKDGIGGMTSLQTLRNVYFEDVRDENDTSRVVELIQELGKLKQLRELVLLNVRDEYMSAISSSINEMRQLEKLSIRTTGYHKVTDFDLNSPPPMLSIVELHCRILEFPKWISKLQNLTKLTMVLMYSMQVDDVLKLLKSMPSLLSLDISNIIIAYERIVFESLHFQDGWFKNLNELHIKFFHRLRYILIDEGALASLKELPKLKSLPTSIQHLSKLEVLSFSSMSEEFKESIALEEGKEHSLFKHVLLKERKF